MIRAAAKLGELGAVEAVVKSFKQFETYQVATYGVRTITNLCDDRKWEKGSNRSFVCFTLYEPPSLQLII